MAHWLLCSFRDLVQEPNMANQRQREDTQWHPSTYYCSFAQYSVDSIAAFYVEFHILSMFVEVPPGSLIPHNSQRHAGRLTDDSKYE